MDAKFNPLEQQEVLSLEENNQFLLRQLMVTPEQLLVQMKNVLASHGGYRSEVNMRHWLGEGMDCEVLKFGSKGWQQGKVRINISIEFCPKEPEIEEIPESTQPDSPLDDLRQMINKETQ